MDYGITTATATPTPVVPCRSLAKQSMSQDRGYCKSARLRYSVLPACWAWTIDYTPSVCKTFCKPGREKINTRPKITLPADPHSRRLAEIRMITNTDGNASMFSWSEGILSRPSLTATINYMNNQETRTKTIHAPNIVDDIHIRQQCTGLTGTIKSTEKKP